MTDAFGGRYCKVATAYASSGALTQLDVKGAGTSSAYIFTPGDVVLNARTGERMLVATVPSTTYITVASAGRAFGTTAAAAGAVDDGLFIIGNANEENGIARNVNSTRVEIGLNYCQIFKRTVSVSGSAKATKLYGGADLEYQRGKAGIEHARDIERAFIWGERKSDTTGTQGKPRRTTGGVKDFIESSGAYVQNQDGGLTAPDMNVFLREGFSMNGTGEKMLMCGGIVLGAISEIARGQLQISQGERSYGLSINKWISPHGVINIVHHPLLVEDFAGDAFLLDMDCFQYRYLAGNGENRDTKLRLDIGANDMDGEIDEYLTECGLERQGAPRCALLKGVTC